jgi:hypothetical protein
MAYLDDWKLCKKTFEAKAGKKPSEKFLGVFRKSSGMEDAAKGLDTALQKLDPKEIDKAVAKYTTTSASYRKLLEGASKEDKGDDYKGALVELGRNMERILANFQAAADARLLAKAQNVLQGIGPTYVGMQQEFNAAREATHEAETAYQECEKIVRLVCVAAPTDAAGAKKLAASLAAPCKTISTISDRVAKSYATVAKTYQSISALGKSQQYLIGLVQRDFDSMRDKAMGIQDGMEDKTVELQELVAKSKAAVKTAADALKGAVDTQQVMLQSLEGFLNRVQKAVVSCNAGVLDKEGGFDTMNFAFMNAKEGKVPADKLEKMMADLHKEGDIRIANCAAETTRITKVQETLIREFSGFHKQIVTDNPQAKAIVEDIQEALSDLPKDLQRLKDVVAKTKKLQAKIKA